MKRRTFVSGVISAGVLSTATTIPALSAASNKTISQNRHSMGASADTSKDLRGHLNPA